MADCFRERTASIERRLEVRKAWHEHFYDNECAHDSLRGAIRLASAEKVMEISPTETEIQVITNGEFPKQRSLYHVKSTASGWLIAEVDTACNHEQIFGPAYECSSCRGTGWLKWKDREIWVPSPPKPGGQTRGRRLHPGLEDAATQDVVLERFMKDFFQERSATYRKENEIHAEHCKRFYAEECDWSRWVPTVMNSEAGKVVSTERLEAKALVITDHSPWCLRYHLYPAGQSWLIKKVDMECYNCWKNGWSKDCFRCGGTVWGQKGPDGKVDQGRGAGEGPRPSPEKPRWKFD